MTKRDLTRALRAVPKDAEIWIEDHLPPRRRKHGRVHRADITVDTSVDGKALLVVREEEGE